MDGTEVLHVTASGLSSEGPSLTLGMDDVTVVDQVGTDLVLESQGSGAGVTTTAGGVYVVSALANLSLG